MSLSETLPDPEKQPIPLVGWLWRDYFRRERVLVVIAFILMAVEGSMLGALSYMIRPMFDNVFIAGNRDAVYLVAAAIGGCPQFGIAFSNGTEVELQ